MKLVTLVSNNVGVDTYLELRKAVNFKPLSRTHYGIGSAIIEDLIKYVEDLCEEGTEIMLDLMCAVGREPFYHKHEFISRPTDKLGPGMIRYIRK